MVYKNKNQHRRCSYFHYLLKVRRDLRLLRTANMEEILRPCFHVILISGKGTKQKLHVLESLKLNKSDSGKPNIFDLLRGALHLLSQVLLWIFLCCSGRDKLGISILLACSFFIGSSVTFLALLSRLRVLIQQILLDAVSVFNLVTSTSLEKQSVNIAHDGVEVFREFYPEDEECTTTFLDCVWKTDKYVLLETFANICFSSRRVLKWSKVIELMFYCLIKLFNCRRYISPSPLLVGDENAGVTASESSTPLAEIASSKTNNGSSQREDSEKPYMMNLQIL
ncbi:BnaC05g26990D [Brassica napus]|uniref:(rape) hypothetical protein n=2 Tax=Brassica TaxID=3705 RepID=A0A078F2L7_BRANA|nr:unnamed protein product [Brassica napus]CDY07337.1 BnaC05g26990D [Brassica napus]